MMVSGPVTPGQVSFFLGFFAVFIAWVYSEILERRKSSSIAKVHSDANLAGLDKEADSQDERDALLEGGLSRSASARLRNTSVRSNLIRLISMDETFLIEQRQVLRAM